jgi:FkbM family methyltransferase
VKAPSPRPSLAAAAAATVIRLGRRLLRNTPLQQLPIVTRVYRFVFAWLHPPGGETSVRYLGSEYIVPTEDLTIVPSLVSGDYERAEFEALEELLRPGDIVIDVGANVGLHAVFCGARVGPEGRVLAFEPEPVNHGYLVRNVERNGLRNVDVFLKGAGGRSGTLRLYLAPGNVGTHSAAAIEGGAAIDVEIVRLDDFLRDRVRRVDLVKIDVEGYEAHVMAGLEETVARDRPALLIEFSPHLLRECGGAPERLLATLQALYPDIRLFEQAGRPAVPLDARAARHLLAVTSGSRNLLCTAPR